MRFSSSGQVAARRGLCGLLLASTLVIGCGGDGGDVDAGSANRPNVLVVTIDTLRLDRLGCYGGPETNSPRIDGLAADGVLFRRTQAQRGLTWPSLTTLITGRHPRSHAVRINGNMLDAAIVTLPEILQDHGFETAGFLSNMCDAPNRGLDTFFCSWWGKDPPLDRKRRRWDSHDQPAWDRAITDEADAFLRRDRDRPFFAWVHYLDPHKPFDVVEGHVRDEYDGSFLPDEEVIDAFTIDGRALDDAQEAQLLAVYDSQVTSTDAHIGRLLDTLTELGIDDETLVIVSADHGEELGDHNAYFYHLASVYQQVLSVPWVMRWPAQLPAGRQIDDEVELADVTPTVLDLLDIEALDGLEGASRAALAKGDAGARGAATVFSEWRDQMVVVGQGRWRFIWNPNEVVTMGKPFSQHPGTGFTIAARELYDLVSDPLQERNVAGEHPEVVAAMLSRACDYLRERPFHESLDATVPEAVREQLESLGYVQNMNAPDAAYRILRHCADVP